MGDIRMSVEVKGRNKRWLFTVYADPKYLPEWQADGVNIERVLNTVPEWWVHLPWPRWFKSAHVWCFFQDILNFKNPWSSR